MTECNCGHIVCVCNILATHEQGCPFRLSATCSVPVECEHGRDVCPQCDKCTCFPDERVDINKEKLKTFLYILLRDHLPSGEVEGIMLQFIGTPMSTSPNKGREFLRGECSNKYVENHALDIIGRLT